MKKKKPNTNYPQYLAHHGVKGMKWGVRHDKEQKASAQRVAKAATGPDDRWWMDDLDVDPDFVSVKKKLGASAKAASDAERKSMSLELKLMNKKYDWSKMNDNDLRSLLDAYDSAEREYMEADAFAKEERKKAVNYLLGKYGDMKISSSKDKYAKTARDWMDWYLEYSDGIDWYDDGSYEYYEPNDDFKKYGID